MHGESLPSEHARICQSQWLLAALNSSLETRTDSGTNTSVVYCIQLSCTVMSRTEGVSVKFTRLFFFKKGLFANAASAMRDHFVLLQKKRKQIVLEKVGSKSFRCNPSSS